MAPSQRQAHLQVPGWIARRQRRVRSLSPPPPRNEEQPQACSIRWSFDVYVTRCVLTLPTVVSQAPPHKSVNTATLMPCTLRGASGARHPGRPAHQGAAGAGAGASQLHSLWIIPTAAVSESWLTAALPVDNPYCSCKLTRSCGRRRSRATKSWRTSARRKATSLPSTSPCGPVR